MLHFVHPYHGLRRRDVPQKGSSSGDEGRGLLGGVVRQSCQIERYIWKGAKS